MAWTASKTIESFEEKPIFLRISFGIAMRRMNNCGFIRWEDAMTEWVFTITLTKRTSFLDYKAHEKMKQVSTKNGSMAIAFAPDSNFVIHEDNNAWTRDLAQSGSRLSSFLSLSKHT